MTLQLFSLQKIHQKSLLNKDVLRLTNNGVGDKDIATVIEFCKEKKITELDLGCNNITDKGVKELCDARLFKKLNLSYNNLTKKSLEYLKEEKDLTYDVSLNNGIK
jgi:Leucine-rich repeat (LRR) protein